MESYNVSPQIRNVAVKDGKESELHASADNAEQGVEEKVSMAPINAV